MLQRAANFLGDAVHPRPFMEVFNLIAQLNAEREALIAQQQQDAAQQQAAATNTTTG